MMTNKVYDALKVSALIAVPVITFISAVLQIWSIPHTAEITATLAAIDALIGGLVTAAKARYDSEAES